MQVREHPIREKGDRDGLDPLGLAVTMKMTLDLMRAGMMEFFTTCAIANRNNSVEPLKRTKLPRWAICIRGLRGGTA